jgi:low affinity Fe/Cu permease
MTKKSRGLAGWLEQLSHRVVVWSGSSWAFLIALATIVVWAVTGPIFNFSDTWQLVINTGTTIVTFLMVFLIQRAQNKESVAVQMKLNELVAAMEGASNRLIDVESLSEEDIERLHGYYEKLAAIAQRETDITRSHSIEEAELRKKAAPKTKPSRAK